MLKQSISDPYNFQHLTHTGTHDAKSLQNASQNDMVTEFSALRASQAPLTELKGIKAENLGLRNGSISGSQATFFPISYEGLTTSAPSSPVKSRDDWTNVSTSEGRLTRHSPSMDSFKRISSRSFSSLTPPVSPPPRRSSRIPITLPYDQLSVGQDSTSFFPNMTNNASSTSLRSNPPSPGASAALSTNPFDQIDPSHVGHAITTLDDSAFNLKPLPLSPSSTALADVPEEDEGHQLELVSSFSPRPSTSNSAIRHTKSFPSISSSPRKSRILTTVPMPASPERIVASDPTLPSSDLQMEEIPRRTSRRVSATINYINDSWEDDIDYCYEHAAEADCAFDWYRVSQEDDKMSSATEVMDEIIDGAASIFEEIPRDSSHSSFTLEGSTASSVQDFRPSYLQAQVDFVHPTNRDLTTLPSHSSSSSAATLPGVLTPFDSSISSPRVFDLSARNSHASLLLPLSPSFSIPREYHSHVIEENVARDKPMTSDVVQHQFPLIGHGGDMSLRRGDSLRSNDSPLSTCHSQESMLQMYSSSVDARHHPSSSLSSLPELVHSESRHEQSDLETEDLVNQIDAMIRNKPLSRFSRVKSLRKATSTTSIVEKVQGDVSSPVASGLFRSRERSLSASEDDRVLPGTSNADRSDKNFASRMRSASAATTMAGSKPSRTSYSLFPNVASR